MKTKRIILFFIIIVIISILFILYKGEMFSKEILKLEISGPANAKIGEEIEYTITYKNNGNFVLEKPKLTFVLSDNSITDDNKTMIVQNLKDIYPGGQESLKFKTRLLGKDGDIKKTRVAISYIPKNITAIYESEASFDTKIDSSPITLDFDLPTKVEHGKNLDYTINYFSNIDYPLENLSIKIDPTAGFDFISSEPKSLDNLEWKLPTLERAQGGRISIKGKITANIDQKLSFTASMGVWRNGSFIVIKQTTIDVGSIQPLLSINQEINGSESYIASPGERLHYKIFFTNIGSTPFTNLSATVKLEDQAFDLDTIEVESGGQVQSGGNIIIWNGDNIPYLKNLNVQEKGNISFYIKLKKDWDTRGNTSITNEVNISQVSKKFTAKVNSGLIITQQGFFKDSEISNYGPTPPMVGEATTYVINWQIKNYFSDAKNVKVKAVLPKNITLTGRISPQDEISNFSFDSQSREIVWSVGDILAGTGVSGDTISLSFQISLTPDNSQKNNVAQLIGPVRISGENQFTNTIITAEDVGIDTTLPDDFSNSGGGVIK